MKHILAKKIGMTTVFSAEGKSVPVTLLKAGPCTVTLVRPFGEGKVNVQMGFEEKKEKNMSKAERGHLKDLSLFRILKEFRFDKTDAKRGDVIDVNSFKVGDVIEVIGYSKGKGFQGVVRRHHFRGHTRTHGTKHAERAPGSIGSGWPQHVIKGVRMAGRMGNVRKTVKGLEVMDIVPKENLLIIKGAVPGAKGALLSVKGN